MKTYTGYFPITALLIAAKNECNAFVPTRVSLSFHSVTQTQSFPPLFAGFGKSETSKKASSATLKPKSQWDRFRYLKQSTAIRVAVRKIDGAWMEVGSIKAKEDTLEAQIAALTVQRALIAEHAKRLFPLQILNKDKIEWGY